MTILTCVSLALTLHSIYTNAGYERICQYLSKNSTTDNRNAYRSFFNKYLKWDGILILHIIEQNTDQVIMSYLVNELYRIYSNTKRQQNNNNPPIIPGASPSFV